MHLYSGRVDVCSHGRIPFRQFDFYFPDFREVPEEPFHDSSAGVFQQFRGNIHFFFQRGVYVCIADGIFYFIRFGGFAKIGFQPQVDDELVTNRSLLWSYSMITVETDVFQKDIIMGSHKYKD